MGPWKWAIIWMRQSRVRKDLQPYNCIGTQEAALYWVPSSSIQPSSAIDWQWFSKISQPCLEKETVGTGPRIFCMQWICSTTELQIMPKCHNPSLYISAWLFRVTWWSTTGHYSACSWLKARGERIVLAFACLLVCLFLRIICNVAVPGLMKILFHSFTRKYIDLIKTTDM